MHNVFRIKRKIFEGILFLEARGARRERQIPRGGVVVKGFRTTDRLASTFFLIVVFADGKHISLAFSENIVGSTLGHFRSTFARI